MQNFFAKVFILVLTLVMAVLFYWIFRPFLGPLILAATLCTVFYPLFLRLEKNLGGRRHWAALLSVLAVIFVVLLPLTVVLMYFTQEAITAVDHVSRLFQQGYFDRYLHWDFWQELQLRYFQNIPIGPQNVKASIEASFSTVGNFVLTYGTSYLASIGRAIFNLFIMLVSMYFFFLDGEAFLIWLMHLTPLKNTYDRLLFTKWREITRSTLISMLAGALTQLIVCGLAYAIVGVPVVLFAVLSGFFAMIPFLGPLVIWLPMALILLVSGKIWQGIFLLIWGVFVISLIDNVVKTYIVKAKVNLHPLLIFFSMIGGISAFGFIGLIIGPVILTLFVTLLDIYQLEFAGTLDRNADKSS